jgi:hypothetical protein
MQLYSMNTHIYILNHAEVWSIIFIILSKFISLKFMTESIYFNISQLLHIKAFES